MFYLILFIYAQELEPVLGMTIPSHHGPGIVDPGLKAEVVWAGKGFFTNMDFLSYDDILVLEKNNGTVIRIVNGTAATEPLIDLNVATKSERGLVGLAIVGEHCISGDKNIKNYDCNSVNVSNGFRYVFLYFTEARSRDGDDNENGTYPVGNRLYRYEFVNNSLKDGALLLDVPAEPGPSHNGGVVAIGPDNNVYVIIGNVNDNEIESFWTRAENIRKGGNPDGRSAILRIDQNGSTVESILGDQNPIDKYYAYGIRNSYGMDFDPVTGNLWDTENGPNYGDEINLVRPGFNSGWNKIQGVWDTYPYVINTSPEGPKRLEDFNGKGRYSLPELTWFVPEALTALKFLDSDKLGERYENEMFVGTYLTGMIYHFGLIENRTKLSLDGPLEDEVADDPHELDEVVFGKGFGRITDMEVGPDGYLYVLAIQADRNYCTLLSVDNICLQFDSSLKGTIYRIVPVDETK